ncbi:MAG TPA: LEA type 2 family protein [Chitinophagaceae bacterium]|nr:LEA type 2 family protein [Chitinophagaceae bacterium]
MFVLVAIVVLPSCQSFQAPEFKNVDNIRLGKMGKKSSSILADVWYYNPNRTRLKLKSAKGEAWMDEVYLGRFEVDSAVNIPAQGNFRLPVILDADMNKLLQHSLTAVLSKEVRIRIKGSARVGKSPFFINYPIEYEGKQRLDQLMIKK